MVKRSNVVNYLDSSLSRPGLLKPNRDILASRRQHSGLRDRLSQTRTSRKNRDGQSACLTYGIRSDGNWTFVLYVSPSWTYSAFPAYSVKTQAPVGETSGSKLSNWRNIQPLRSPERWLNMPKLLVNTNPNLICYPSTQYGPTTVRLTITDRLAKYK